MTTTFDRDMAKARESDKIFATVTGNMDAYSRLSSIRGDIDDVHAALSGGAFFGWNIRPIEATASDSSGIYQGGDKNQLICADVPALGGRVVLGRSTKDWKPIQVEQIVPLLDALAMRGLKMNSAIPGPTTLFVFQGEKIPLSRDTRQVGDVVQDQVIVRLGNTGTTSLSVIHRPRVLACANGAVAASTMGLVRINHSGLANERVEATSNLIISRGETWLQTWREEASQLVETEVSQNLANEIWGEFLGWADKQGRSLTAQEHQQSRLNELWRQDQNRMFPNTAWAAYMTLTEYLDHHGGRVEKMKGESRTTALARRQVSGRTDALKARVWKHMLQLAA